MKHSNQISVTDANARSVKRDKFTRRGLLGIGGAALAVAGIGPAIHAAGPGQDKTDRSRSDPGPGNPALDAQNPDSMWPPDTDSKSLVRTFKYPFSLANKRVYEGGWSREVTVRELPISKSMAGVNMRLAARRSARKAARCALLIRASSRSQQLLSGRFALGVAGPYAAGTGHGAPAHRSGDVIRYSEG
jgi:hypothetical protein